MGIGRYDWGVVVNGLGNKMCLKIYKTNIET